MGPEPSTHTRRTFLSGALGVGAGVAAMPLTGLPGAHAAGATGETAATILTLATTAEMLAVTFYSSVLARATYHIEASGRDSLQVVLATGMAHLAQLSALGGRGTQQVFFLPERLFSDAQVCVTTGLRLETALAELYLGATYRLAVLNQPRLAANVAQYAACASAHQTLLSSLANLPHRPVTGAAPDASRLSHARSILAPFLRADAGFTKPVQFPSSVHGQTSMPSTA